MTTTTPITGSGALVAGLDSTGGYGELSLFRTDDSYQSFNIQSVFGSAGLTINGQSFTSIYVNNNGSVSFGNGISQYTPTSIPDASVPMIAPYWADVDTRIDGAAPESGSVYVDLDAQRSVLTVTWDDVGYYDYNADKANSFQLQLFNRGSGNFDIVFRYADINWTTGDASGGSGGLGGTAARAGYSLGDGINFFELPQAGNQTALLGLDSTAGNTGVTGLWSWSVRGGQFNEYLPSAQDVFNANGKLAFLANMAAAAYHLVPGEPISDASNDAAPTAVQPYSQVDIDLKYLTGADLPTLVPQTGTGTFPLSGIRNGMFVAQNAAALVGRTSDALFVSFRGTNDNGADSQISADKGHWSSKDNHFALFQPLLTALDTYLAQNPQITAIYVTGHSLGAGMIQPFVDYADANYGVAVEAVSFATPGYGLGFDTADPRITNFWNVHDIIRAPQWFSSVAGDKNIIENGILGPITSHSMDLYLGEIKLLRSEGIELSQLNRASWNGVEYDSIHLRAAVLDEAAGSFAVGTADDFIMCLGTNDLILGGDGKDFLYGGAGNDALFGGNGDDFIFGQLGKDTLAGGSGVDTLTGGDLRDILTGGGSKDVFNFDYTYETRSLATLRDQITDFTHALDKIDLKGIDANQRFGAIGNQAFHFIGSAQFHKAAGELRFSYANPAGVANDRTIIEGDTNGDGRADFQIELLGLKVITAVDFVL